MSKTNEPDFSERMAALVEQWTVTPEPDPEPDPDPTPETLAADEQNRRNSAERLAISRDCPAKLAREVARTKPGHRFQLTHAIKATMTWLAIPAGDDHREVLVLCGERGLGKSYAAAQALAACKPDKDEVDKLFRGYYRLDAVALYPRWANARHLADWLHASASYASTLDEVQRAPMLVLDDLGWEHFDRAGYTRSAIIGLIDDRIQAELRTIITSNMSEDEFLGRYGDALHDRIRGYGVWVDVESGPSMR